MLCLDPDVFWNICTKNLLNWPVQDARMLGVGWLYSRTTLRYYSTVVKEMLSNRMSCFSVFIRNEGKQVLGLFFNKKKKSLKLHFQKVFHKQAKLHIFQKKYDLTREEWCLKYAPDSVYCFMIIQIQHWVWEEQFTKG